MPDIGRGREDTRRRSTGWAWLLAFVLLAAAAICAAASSDGSAPASARAVSAQPSPSPAPGPGEVPAGEAAPANAPAAAGSAARAAQPAAAARTAAAVAAASMDTPIQGGLSVHQEQARSAQLVSAHQDAAAAPRSAYWTPAEGVTAVERAQSWLGMPYSWAGGNASGPTLGQCAPGTGGDLDCHVVGFDCSGLTMYAWGPYTTLPHLADAQRSAGAFHPTVDQLLPGDLVFFSGYLAGGTGHVAIYAGDGMVVEAPQSGSVTRLSTLADLMAEDGVYRGAVRPLTGQTPTLVAPRVAVSSKGATITLRGAHLGGVDAVYVAGIPVRRFVQQSDSAIVFRAPAHEAGSVAVAVSTSWFARSASVALTYVQPRSASRTDPPAPPTAPTTVASQPPTSTAPTTPRSTPTRSAATTTPSSSPSTAAAGSAQQATAGGDATG